MSQVRTHSLRYSLLFTFAVASLCSQSMTVWARPAAKPVPKTATLTIGTNPNENLFDKKSLTVSAGQAVKLTYKNHSPSMQHNFTLVEKGAAEEVANEGIAAGADKGWLSDSKKIIAHTKLLNPGESETISFDAPKEPGEYPFICTFPGHWTTMSGVLIVK